MTFDALLAQASRYRMTEQALKADAESVFVCIRGAHADGHDFAPEAYARGCRLFVAEHPLPLPADAETVTVSDTHTALAALAARTRESLPANWRSSALREQKERQQRHCFSLTF